MTCDWSLASQVPYETLNKRFRAAQKNIDRESSHVSLVVAELEKTLGSFPVVHSVVSLLDGVVEKLSALKRKVREVQHLEIHSILINRVINHLYTLYFSFEAGFIIKSRY